MRKFTFLISFLLLFSLLLAACGGAGEGTEGTADLQTPSTGFETEFAPTLAGTVAMETPAMTLEPTGLVTEAPTEMASPTVEATELPSTPAPVLPGTGAIDPSRLSNLLGLSVSTLDGEDAGEVEDLVIDLDESQIRYVILASGSILGIGERLVPIPWDGVTIDPACGDITGTGEAETTGTETPAAGGTGTPAPAMGGAPGITETGTPAAGGTDNITGAVLQGECFFTVNVDQQTLENAPNVDLDAIPDVSVEDWDQEFLNYWNAFDMGTGGSQMVTGTPAAGGMSGTGMPTAGSDTATPAAGAMAGTSTPAPGEGAGTETPAAGSRTLTVSRLQGMILAKDLLGLNLVSRNGDPLGEVEDAILDLETGVVRYILISADASLDIAGNWVPVPLETLGRGDTGELVLDIEEEAMTVLSAAPSFDANSMPDTRHVDWDTEITGYWSTINP
jgi:sporulation protein YlmC with PRC-barrel domain